MKYGKEIEWDYGWFYGPKASVKSDGYDDKESAFMDVLKGAIEVGWAPPRWWQWWRWSESYWHWSKEDKETARKIYNGSLGEDQAQRAGT